MTLEERVAFLEGRVDEQARAGDGIRDAVAQVELRMGQFEERMDRRFEALDERFETLEARMDRRFEGIDMRFERIERRVDMIDDKLTRYFTWLVGIQVSTLIAVVTAFFTTISMLR